MKISKYQAEKILRRHGISINEHFLITLSDKITTKVCRYSRRNKSFQVWEPTEEDLKSGISSLGWKDWNELLYAELLADELVVSEPLDTPKSGTKYYFITDDDNYDPVIGSIEWTNSFSDRERFVLGNVFKSREEAMKHTDEVLEIIYGKPLVDFSKE